MDWIKDNLHALVEWVAHFAHTPYGAWALFTLSFAESSFFPIPPDVLLLALCVAQPESSLWFALICSVASVLGGLFGYWIGLKGGRPLMMRMFNHKKVQVVEDYYQRWDVWAVGAAGLTPLPYKLFTISAGVFELNLPRFILASVLSRSARFFGVGVLFWLFGAAIQSFIKQYFGWITAGIFVLLVAGFWAVKIMGHRAVGKQE